MDCGQSRSETPDAAGGLRAFLGEDKMTRSSILDDPSIGARAQQIAAEERRALLEGCDCPSVINAATGAAVKQHERGCRHFVDPYYGCGFAAACPAAVRMWADLGRSMIPIGVRYETPATRLVELGVRIGGRA